MVQEVDCDLKIATLPAKKESLPVTPELPTELGPTRPSFCDRGGCKCFAVWGGGVWKAAGRQLLASSSTAAGPHQLSLPRPRQTADLTKQLSPTTSSPRNTHPINFHLLTISDTSQSSYGFRGPFENTAP